ncbi:hypothetical protein DQE82_26640 [Micromonospora sp. LHW51205]|uniref:hypothetical protein n=1 Tax=Micromonospora sp. LHW51205 TaxID=2248752 RepID=UPI000DE96DDB|nr:hypothetical protein [Micromonospora sp. LHW51205]RBQ05130.1 hypothetical protein DQE82_26640 [Micromonospora sp. LHW51205]
MKRPTPILSGVAGGICALGVIAVVARALHTFTDFTLAPPFDTFSFLLALVCWFAAPAMVGWIRTLSIRQQNAELRAENRRLLAEATERESLLERIRLCDQEVEVVKVKVGKVLRMLEQQQIPVGDTQDLRRLHSINGGGGA